MKITAAQKKTIRMTVDICIAVFLLLLMSYQATGEKIHEWIGLGMAAMILIHQLLNLGWYKALVTGKGRRTSFRIAVTVTDLLLLLSLVLTAFSGMSMSVYAVPFLYGMASQMIVRRMHLAVSHWCLILAAIHFGFHVPAIENRYFKGEKARNVFAVSFTCAAGIGSYVFLKNRILSYIFFIAAFAVFELGKPRFLVFLEYALIFVLWSFIGYIIAQMLSVQGKKDSVL